MSAIGSYVVLGREGLKECVRLETPPPFPAIEEQALHEFCQDQYGNDADSLYQAIQPRMNSTAAAWRAGRKRMWSCL